MIQNNQSISIPNTRKMDNLAAFQTRQILSLGRRNGWGFTVLGKADLPDRPIHLEKWLIVPAVHDSSEISPRTYEKIRAIYAEGIKPQGFVIVHEAPRYLAAPKSTSKHNPAPSYSPKKQATQPGIQVTDVLTSVMTVMASTMMFALGALVMGVALIDPILVAVMEDGSWVEIDRWETKV